MEYEKIIVIERVLFMSFFSDLGKAFSSSGSNNVQNTNAGSDISKLNRTINENKSKIENAYKEIGNIYFNTYGENPAPELAEKVNFIKQLTSDIEKMEEEIKLLNGYIRCPKCAVLVKNTDFVCYNCGEKLRAPEVDNRCPGCGAEMIPNASFCTKCGRPVTAAQQSQQPQQSVAFQEPQQPQQSVVFQEPQQPQQSVVFQQPQQPQPPVVFQEPQQPQQSVVFQEPQQPQQSVVFQEPQQPQPPVTFQQPQQPQQVNLVQQPASSYQHNQQASPMQQPVNYQQPPVEQSAPVQPEIPKPEKPNVKVCHYCGYEMDASNSFCLRCGEKL